MLEQGRHGRVLPAVERPFVFPDHRSCLAGEMPAGGKPDDAYSRRSVAPPCHNLGSHGIEGSREPRVQRIPERSSNRSAREARPPALLLPRSVFAADHPAPEYCRIRDEDPLTVRHVRRLRDGDPGAEYLSQGAVGGPRAVLAGQEIMHGRVAEQPDAGRHFQRRGVLGAHVGEQRHEPPKVCFLLCQSLAARSGGCVVRGWGCQVPHGACQVILFLLSVRAGIGEKVPRKPGRRSLGRAGSGA